MADRTQPLSLDGAGKAASAALLVLILGALFVVAATGTSTLWLGPSDWAALRFTVLQAVLSAAISVLLAIPLARALMRRRFPLHGLAITFLGAPFLLPVLVAVLGVLAVFGRNGVISQMMMSIGLPPIEIYGLQGIVLTHVFFNLPLATRLILQGWLSIPSEQIRLAHALGFGPSEAAQHLERPVLQAVLPGAFLVIFLICSTSFAVALTMGGGPRATTLELAIYQAFRFEFDLSRAAVLGAVQVALCAVAVLAIRMVPTAPDGFGGLDTARLALPKEGKWVRAQDIAMLLLGLGFLLFPILMIFVRGIPFVIDLPSMIWIAGLRSLGVATASVLMMLVLALPIATSLARTPNGWPHFAAALPIAVSPLVLGLGAFVALRPWLDPGSVVLPLTAFVNAVMSLPFVLRSLVPELKKVDAHHGRLAVALGMSRSNWIGLIVLPRLQRALGFGAGMTAALSMGDLGVIALFGSVDRGTLPLAIYQLMGSYQMDAAAGAALILMALTLGVFWVFDRGGRFSATV
jgi:thiamine transport system permease protein